MTFGDRLTSWNQSLNDIPPNRRAAHLTVRIVLVGAVGLAVAVAIGIPGWLLLAIVVIAAGMGLHVVNGRAMAPAAKATPAFVIASNPPVEAPPPSPPIETFAGTPHPEPPHSEPHDAATDGFTTHP